MATGTMQWVAIKLLFSSRAPVVIEGGRCQTSGVPVTAASPACCEEITMAKGSTMMDFLMMRSARRQPKTRGSWLYGAGPFALIVVTVFFLAKFDVPYGWKILIIVLVGFVVCPALVLLATVVSDRNRS